MFSIPPSLSPKLTFASCKGWTKQMNYDTGYEEMLFNGKRVPSCDIEGDPLTYTISGQLVKLPYIYPDFDHIGVPQKDSISGRTILYLADDKDVKSYMNPGFLA
jgi:hypothetical protein